MKKSSGAIYEENFEIICTFIEKMSKYSPANNSLRIYAFIRYTHINTTNKKKFSP